MARYFIITGESSGDRLGAFLGRALLSQGHQVQAWGGEQMKKAGIPLVQDHVDFMVMGWTDVVVKIPLFVQLFNKCKADLKRFQPDILILIDFGGFNLRIARWAKNLQTRIIYYSPPKVWASRTHRIEKIKQFCDQIIVLFPFEHDYYNEQGLEAEYYGHPFASEVIQFRPTPGFRMTQALNEKQVLSILPGSRTSEIKYCLPVYLRAVRDLSDYQICISSVGGQKELISKICVRESVDARIIENRFYDLLSITDLALVTSGTASFEAALFKVSQIVGYKTSGLNYFIGKSLIKTDFIALPNLICNKEVVPELIQNHLNPFNIQKNIIRICQPIAKSEMEKSYSSIIFETFKENCLFNTITAISD